jgi:hypothetical protein
MRTEALASHTRKGKRGSFGRRGSPRRRDSPKRLSSPKLRWKKDLRKISCFECHDYGHYASQCSHWKGRGRRKQALTTKVDEVVDRF